MTTTQDREYSVPILESGDRLTRHEFERRYQSMPHLKKAALIEGVVYGDLARVLTEVRRELLQRHLGHS